MLLSAMPFAMHAQGGVRSVVVKMTDGTVNYVTIEKGMTAEFTAKSLAFAGPNTSVELDKAKVESMSFSETVGINEINGDAFELTVAGSEISLKGLPAGSTVAVYDTAGRCLSRAVADGDYTLSADSFAAGVYIVNVNGVSYKISFK